MNKKTLLTLLSSTAIGISLSLILSGCGQDVKSNDNTVAVEVPVELHNANQQDIDDIAANLDIKYRVITNVPTDKCDVKISDGACFEVELSLTTSKTILANNWAIYFSHIAPVQSSTDEEFRVSHLNGDLHKVSLLENFSGFKAGETKTLAFRANFWMLSETDALPNYIVTADELQARVINSTKTVIDADTGLDLLPFVEPFTDVVKQFKRSADDKTQWLTSEALYQRNTKVAQNLEVTNSIIPTPKSINYDQNNKVVSTAKGLNIDYGNVDVKDITVVLERLAKFGLTQNSSGLAVNLNIVADNNKAIGSYHLDITAKGITIVGVDGNGVFNGLQSLASLVTVGKPTLPLLTIVDEPHYAFRGMLVDVARNFHSKEFILKLLEQMAAYKLNKLHLHLGDDEGWRLEIPSLPELTEVGSKRCFDQQEQNCLISQLGAGIDTSSAVNGYYSVSDYQEILKAATARHIQVIPSLDMPGHSRSSIKAMAARYNKYIALEDEEKAKEFLLHDIEDTTEYSSVQFYNDNTINVCMESSYAFITEVMKQVKKIHQDAGQPLTRYHIGADETAGAWIESPVCKEFVKNNNHGVTDISQVGAYFIERVASILSNLDIETAGWSDGLEHTRKENMPAIVQANAWDVLFWGGHEKVHQLANRDWQIVISTPDVMYFDFPYEADPKEHGYYWASRHTNTEKIFQFMPDNLPIHAEFWLDRQDHAYSADDRKSSLAKGKKFLGLQGQLWSENTRNDDMAEHKVFPRLLALAERAWHLPTWAVPYNYKGFKYSPDSGVFTEQAKSERDNQWQVFANTLGKKEFAKLDLADVSYRLPTVGAKIENGQLLANIAFPGLIIEYQEQGQSWKKYLQPVAVTSSVKVRSRSKNRKRVSRTTQVH